MNFEKEHSCYSGSKIHYLLLSIDKVIYKLTDYILKSEGMLRTVSFAFEISGFERTT